MVLLNKELISVQPKKRTIDSGKNVPVNDGDPLDIWASVQPIGAAVLQRLPEGARTSAKWIVYTEGPTKPFEILPAPPGIAPRLTTSRGVLVPVAEIDYSHSGPGAVLPNCGYACAELAVDEPTP